VIAVCIATAVVFSVRANRRDARHLRELRQGA